LDEALRVAVAIADALDKAHREGLIHGNLRPSNVMLMENGIKVLDFGLPSPKPPAPSAARRSAAGAATEAETSERKPASLEYLAPEQLEGGATDARSDVFAFGTILYEMISGKKAFEGKTAQLLIAAIVSLDLDPPSTFEPAAPPALDHLAERCSAKSPEDRWQTAHSVLVQLQWILEGGSGAAAAAAAQRRKRERRLRILLGVAAIVIAAIGGPAFLYLRGATTSDELRFRVPVVGINPEYMAVSPDGKNMALVVSPDNSGGSSLYVRPVGGLSYRLLAGTTEAVQPFWSPDSRFIAFVSGGKLKAVEMTGGAPKDICGAADFAGGTWGSRGTILFGSSKGLFQVSAEGGNAEPLTTLDKQESGHFWPHFLPDGQHYLYLAWGASVQNRGVYVGALGSKDRTKLMSAESNVAYAEPGYLFFHREGTIFAQPFDASSLKLKAQPIHVADQLRFSGANGRGSFDVSRAAEDGALIYFQGAAAATGRGGTVGRQWAWRTRTGQQTELAGEQGQYGDMDLSPDQKFIAVTRQEIGAANADIWVIDWQRGTSTQVTRDSGDNINPVWSPDGKRVAYTSYRKGNADVYLKNADGVGEETPLLATSTNEAVEDWSKDGRFLIYLAGDDFQDIYALPMRDGKPDGQPIAVVKGHFRKDEPQLSYDGKWLAYASDKSGGTFQVYVTSFPAGDQEIQISTEGGGQPRWRADGKELFYRNSDSTVMLADIKAGAKIEAMSPRLLFVTNQANTNAAINPVRHQWSVAPDGQRFLVPSGNNQIVTRGNAGQSSAPRVQGGTFAPPGQAGGGAGARGRAASQITTGLTVVQHWTSALSNAKGEKQ
jgi:Tol biopolymer transport system component